MAAIINCLILGAVAIFLQLFHLAIAVTDDERTGMRAAAIPMIMACGADHGVTKEQLLAAKEAKNPDALNPCFYSCFFKKTGVMNENGLFDPDVTLERQKKYIHNEEEMKKMSELVKTCSSVNDQNVGDGTKGCERAKLLVQCVFEHKSVVTPFLS